MVEESLNTADEEAEITKTCCLNTASVEDLITRTLQEPDKFHDLHQQLCFRIRSTVCQKYDRGGPFPTNVIYPDPENKILIAATLAVRNCFMLSDIESGAEAWIIYEEHGDILYDAVRCKWAELTGWPAIKFPYTRQLVAAIWLAFRKRGDAGKEAVACAMEPLLGYKLKLK
jgi:hypothetical protein